MDKKKSKFLSWLRIPGFMQKNQGSTNKVSESAEWKTQGNTQLEQSFGNEAILPTQCCCQHISKQMQALNICHSSSYHNDSRNKHKHYADEHILCKEARRENLHSSKENSLENKENFPGSLYKVWNCCCYKDVRHDCCQKLPRSKIHLCEYSACNARQGCTYCSQAVLLAPKCLRRQLRSCEANRDDSNGYQCKYRSIGVNTTPQQITAAAETNFCYLKDCAPSLCENVPLFPKCKKPSLQHNEHLKESRCKARNQYYDNRQLKLLEEHSLKEEFSKRREDFVPTTIKCDCFTAKYGHSKLAATTIIDSAESHARRQKHRNERILKARLRHINKTLPKSWKHKAVRDDDCKSTFADDEKSEFDSSGGTNYLKQTCL